jgi:hypothetical protein
MEWLTEADSGCASRIAWYMNQGRWANALDQGFIYPDAVAWKAGVRTITCDVCSLDGPISGSVRQALDREPLPDGRARRVMPWRR